MLAPDRVRGKPRRGAFVGVEQLRKLRASLGRGGPRTPTPPTGYAIAELVEPFGVFMPWLAHLLEMIRARFRDAILFHCGGLDLYPASFATNPKS